MEERQDAVTLLVKQRGATEIDDVNFVVSRKQLNYVLYPKISRIQGLSTKLCRKKRTFIIAAPFTKIIQEVDKTLFRLTNHNRKDHHVREDGLPLLTFK